MRPHLYVSTKKTKKPFIFSQQLFYCLKTDDDDA